MQSSAPLKRNSRMPYIVWPQVIILVFFVLSRAEIWARLTFGGASVSDFFFEIVSAGAGWAMLSISTLLSSMMFSEMDRIYFKNVIERQFQDISAGALASEITHHVKMVRRLFKGIAVWSIFTISVGAATLFAARSTYGDAMQADICGPLIISVILCMLFSFAAAVCSVGEGITAVAVMAEAVDQVDWTLPGLKRSENWNLAAIDDEQFRTMIQKKIASRENK